MFVPDSQIPGPSGDQVEFVPELADQKNAGLSLVSSGSDCQREQKFVTKHDPAPPRWDQGSLQLQVVEGRRVEGLVVSVATLTSSPEATQLGSVRDHRPRVSVHLSRSGLAWRPGHNARVLPWVSGE